MNRIIYLLIAVAAGIAMGGLGARGAEANQPDIVLIMANDLGWGVANCNQPCVVYKTPNIDRLEKEGIRFSRLNRSIRGLEWTGHEEK